jgi:hypothetical protein
MAVHAHRAAQRRGWPCRRLQKPNGQSRNAPMLAAVPDEI